MNNNWVILYHVNLFILRIQAGFHFRVTQVMFPVLCLGGCLWIYPNCNTTHSVARLTLFAPQNFSTTITCGSFVHRCSAYPEWSRETVCTVSLSQSRALCQYLLFKIRTITLHMSRYGRKLRLSNFANFQFPSLSAICEEARKK